MLENFLIRHITVISSLSAFAAPPFLICLPYTYVLYIHTYMNLMNFLSLMALNVVDILNCYVLM